MLIVQQTLATEISMNLFAVVCTEVQFTVLHWHETKTDGLNIPRIILGEPLAYYSLDI